MFLLLKLPFVLAQGGSISTKVESTYGMCHFMDSRVEPKQDTLRIKPSLVVVTLTSLLLDHGRIKINFKVFEFCQYNVFVVL
jgi:hypothetical protein